MSARLASDGTPIIHTSDSCSRKVGYKSERAAWFAIRRGLREGRLFKNPGTYECSVCGKWHAGRRPS